MIEPQEDGLPTLTDYEESLNLSMAQKNGGPPLSLDARPI